MNPADIDKGKPKEDFLRKVPLFSDLTSEELNDIQRVFVEKIYKKNQIIFLEEDTGDYMYLVKSGKVKVSKATPEGKEYTNKGLREAVLAVMPVQQRLKPDATELGSWLRGRRERRVGKLRFCNKPAGGHRPAIWWVEREK